jgi:hypothetical protein
MTEQFAKKLGVDLRLTLDKLKLSLDLAADDSAKLVEADD